MKKKSSFGKATVFGVMLLLFAALPAVASAGFNDDAISAGASISQAALGSAIPIIDTTIPALFPLEVFGGYETKTIARLLHPRRNSTSAR